MKENIAVADEALLATLGYKQEFQRAFTPLEVCTLCCRLVRWPVLMTPTPSGIWHCLQYHRAAAVHRVSLQLPLEMSWTLTQARSQIRAILCHP